jgi:uncharacterized membrane protein YjjP (DUF1212 family)
MNYTLLMELVSRIGGNMGACGAETYRVEESVKRILAAYGLESRVYSVPKSLFITIIIPGQAPLSQLCRTEQQGTNLDMVEQYSNLSRRICAQRPDPETAMQWLQEVEQSRKRYSLPMVLIGNMMVAWGFCIFFGGSVIDSLCAVLCGLLLGVAEHFLGKLQTNIFFREIAVAFLMAFLAYGLGIIGLAENVDAVVIGTLMLLVPGLLFTNAMRDIIFGDTNSGINRVVVALLIAVAVAVGTATAWNLCTSLWGVPPIAETISHSPLVTCFVSFVACAGFVIVFNIHGRGKLLCALGAAITWGAYCLALEMGYSSLLCCFIATCVAAIFSEIMARVRKYPATSYLVISLLPLIPGAGIYYTALRAVQGEMLMSSQYGMDTLSTAGVMAAGILVVSTTIRMLTDRKRS